MTNAQKWVFAFLGMFVILFLLSKVSQKDESTADEDGYYGDSFQETAELQGLPLLKKIGCTSCHGDDLKGTVKAPGLYQAKEYWSRKALINYLRNPSAYSGGNRFEMYREKFKNVVMPSYGNRNVKQLGKIAEFILSLE